MLSGLETSLDELASIVGVWAPGASIEDETKQVVSVIDIHGKDVPVFIRVLSCGSLIQLLAFLPCKLEPMAISDTGRFLHLINKSLDRPGLGVDEVFGVIFYRTVLPLKDSIIDIDQLHAAWQAMESVVESYVESIRPVAAGSVNFEEVFSLIVKGEE